MSKSFKCAICTCGKCNKGCNGNSKCAICKICKGLDVKTGECGEKEQLQAVAKQEEKQSNPMLKGIDNSQKER